MSYVTIPPFCFTAAVVFHDRVLLMISKENCAQFSARSLGSGRVEVGALHLFLVAMGIVDRYS